VVRIFIALKNPSPWPGFETATFGSSGQHAKHYTTKATFRCFYRTKFDYSPFRMLSWQHFGTIVKGIFL
jgi:hypothetical protein